MISFRSLTTSKDDMELLYMWLTKPHIIESWDPAPHSIEEVITKYEKKLALDSVFPYVILVENNPIGYIQGYYANTGDEWWQDQPTGTYGLDLFIGDERVLGQGIGSKVVAAFAEKLFQEKDAKKIIVDPKPENARAIRAYEKAGFVSKGVVNTPDGEALLMEKFPH